MKRVYLAPIITEVNFEPEAMLAVSLPVGSDDKIVDTSDPSSQLGNDRRGEWGNLWN